MKIFQFLYMFRYSQFPYLQMNSLKVFNTNTDLQFLYILYSTYFDYRNLNMVLKKSGTHLRQNEKKHH